MIPTTSIETSKKLKEAGFNRDTMFHWVNDGKGNEKINWELEFQSPENFWAAPTTDEILEKLKQVQYESHGFPSLMIFYAFNKWNVCYRNPPLKWIDKGSQDAGTDEILVEACAKMYLWLKAEGMI